MGYPNRPIEPIFNKITYNCLQCLGQVCRNIYKVFWGRNWHYMIFQQRSMQEEDPAVQGWEWDKWALAAIQMSCNWTAICSLCRSTLARVILKPAIQMNNNWGAMCTFWSCVRQSSWTALIHPLAGQKGHCTPFQRDTPATNMSQILKDKLWNVWAGLVGWVRPICRLSKIWYSIFVVIQTGWS